jgi:hypothetical protein
MNLLNRSFLPIEEEWMRKVLVQDESIFDILCERHFINNFTLFEYSVNYQRLDSETEVSADLIDEIGRSIIMKAYDCEL